MAKTTKPIRVLCLGMQPTAALEQLRTDGHTVDVVDTSELKLNTYVCVTGYDMIVGPTCWRYLPDVSDKFIKLMVKEARATQPPRVKKAKVKKSGTPAS